jgi:hypothetical protein
VSDIDTAVVVVGLKALDPEWPIREAIDPLQSFGLGELFLSKMISDPPSAGHKSLL